MMYAILIAVIVVLGLGFSVGVLKAHVDKVKADITGEIAKLKSKM